MSIYIRVDTYKQVVMLLLYCCYCNITKSSHMFILIYVSKKKECVIKILRFPM